MYKTITFFVMVGGTEEDRPLNKPERRRVVAAIKKHLKGRTFAAAFYGDNRLMLEIALLATANQFSLVPIRDRCFSLNELAPGELEKISRTRQELSKDDHLATVGDWLKRLRLANVLRKNLLRDLAATINELDGFGGQPLVLIVARSPLAEIALDPATPLPEVGDVVCYTFGLLTSGPCRLASSNVLKAPTVR